MKRLAWVAAMSLAAACGGGDDAADPDGAPLADASDIDATVPTADAAPNRGFIPPVEVTTAYTVEDGAFVEVGPANWGCIGDPDSVETTEEEVDVTGRLKEFGGGEEDRVEGAEIVVFAETDFYASTIAGPVTTSEAEEDGEGTVLDPGGEYEGITLDPGVTRVAFRATAEGYVDTYSLNRSFAADATEGTVDLDIVPESLANILAALVLGGPRTPGLGIVAGSIVDCDGNTVKHAIATVSTVAGEVEHLPGVETYYFNGNPEGPAPSPPRIDSHEDGLILIPELDPTEDFLYVQVWGFVDADALASGELELLSELETNIPDNGLLTTGLPPLASPANGDNGDE
jgi:hypothetical protein